MKRFVSLLFAGLLAVSPARATFLINSYAIVPATAFDLAFVTSAVTTSGGTSFTFSSQSLGAADATRYIIVSAGGQVAADNTISSITVQGISGSQVVTSGDGGETRASIWIIAVPTGTTGDVVVTFSGTANNCGIAVYRMVGATSAIPTATASDNSITSNAESASLTIPTGGAGVGYFLMESTITTRTATWTNLTEDMDQLIESSSAVNSHSSAASLTPGTSTITATASGSLLAAELVLAAWAPAPATVVLTRGTCVSDTANATTYSSSFGTVGTGASASDTGLVVVGVTAEDGQTVFNVASMTINGSAATSLIDEGGVGIVDTAIFALPTEITNAATVAVSVTFSEAISNATVCAWMITGLQSLTPVSVIKDDDTASGPLILTLPNTTPGGYALGVCNNSGVADSTTWTNLTEREDTQNAESDYSNADGATTGGSLAVTCDWTGANDASGSAAAFR